MPGARKGMALIASLGVALSGCASASGDRPAAAGGTPLAVVLATNATAAATGATNATAAATGATHATSRRHGARATRPSSGHPAVAGDGPDFGVTPISAPRARSQPRIRALAPTQAARLAAPACAGYRDAVAGRYPAVVIARGERRAMAVVTHSTAAALLGLPIAAPDASRASRERLDGAFSRLSAALDGAGDGAPAALAAAMAPRVRAYARALGIDACG